MKLLEGTLIRLRAPEPEDLEYFYKWENDSDIWLISNTITPFSRYILKEYIATAHLDIYENKQLRLMIDTLDGMGTIGSIDLFDFDPYHNRAGVGILIGEESDRGKGYADDALKVLINYAFAVLKLHQLYCNIGSENQKSLRLFQNNGFSVVGEKKEWNRGMRGWQDEYLLQLINC